MKRRILSASVSAAMASAAPSLASVEDCGGALPPAEREPEQVFIIRRHRDEDEFPTPYVAKSIADARTYALPGRGGKRATGARAQQRRSRKSRGRR